MKQAVTAVIQVGDQVLLHQRSLESRGQPGKWENAGGEIDEGETPDQAIIREIKEELGVEFIIDKVIYDDVFDSGEDKWHVFIYGGSIKGTPRVMIPEETIDVKWFKLAELKDVDLATYTHADFVKFGWIK